MSALNIHLADDAAHVFTDGALYYRGTEGAVAAFGNKVWPLPQFDAVIGATGASWPIFMIANQITAHGALGTATDFAELRDTFPKLIRDSIALSQSMNMPDWGHYVAALIGWNREEGRAEAYRISRFDRDEAGAFEMEAVSDIRSPADAFVRDTPFRAADAAASGLAIMEKQRNLRTWSADEPDAGPISCVGGFCQHTIVSADGITTRAIHHWPDEIGGTTRRNDRLF